MPRGVIPRQPARTGRQDKVRVGTGRLASLPRAEPRRLGQSKASAATRDARVYAGAKSAALSRSKPGAVKAPKGYKPVAPERVAEILKRLDQLYPDVTCALTHRSAWELLVATILSAQSTDVNVNRVTPELFRKYPTVEAFAALTPEQLEPDVRSTGFFRNKSKSVVGAAKKIVSDFGGQVPDDMEKLLTLPGVARKTANVVLGNAYGIPGITVDTHFGRLSRRFGWTTSDDPVKVEAEVGELIPKSDWVLLSHRLIWHGRRICHARKPACGACPVADWCPSFGLGPTDAATAAKLVKEGPFS